MHDTIISLCQALCTHQHCSSACTCQQLSATLPLFCWLPVLLSTQATHLLWLATGYVGAHLAAQLLSWNGAQDNAVAAVVLGIRYRRLDRCLLRSSCALVCCRKREPGATRARPIVCPMCWLRCILA